MNNNLLPTVSVVMPTYNSARTLDRAISSIKNQQYPEYKIEIIIIDGGSTDNSIEIAKKHGAKVMRVNPLKQNAEYNKSLGIRMAKNEIIAMIDHDNILPHPGWLRNMVAPFSKHKEVIGVETLRYNYDSQTTLIDRYFALFGAGDPLVWYLGKADRLSYIFDTYSLAGRHREYKNYYLVDFTAENMTTIGANGYLVRRKELMKYAQVQPGEYFDMDVNIDLIKSGFHRFAFVKDSILHLTGYGSVWYFLKRRMLFLSQYNRASNFDLQKKVRRYGILSKKDWFRLGMSIIICATFIIPMIDSIRGYRKIQDNAWFLHPILCFGFVVIYSWVTIVTRFDEYAKKILAR